MREDAPKKKELRGAKLGAVTAKKRHGADFHQNIGRKGGQVKTRKGFAAMSKARHKAASSKGGRVRKNNLTF